MLTSATPHSCDKGGFYIMLLSKPEKVWSSCNHARCSISSRVIKMVLFVSFDLFWSACRKHSQRPVLSQRCQAVLCKLNSLFQSPLYTLLLGSRQFSGLCSVLRRTVQVANCTTGAIQKIKQALTELNKTKFTRGFHLNVHQCSL